MMLYDALIAAPRTWSVALDWGFNLVHFSLTVFILVGWIRASWRKAHLAAVAIVWLCWIAGGLYVGNLGYCPLTDWHWQVKLVLGEVPLPSSYIEYLYWETIGRDVDDALMAQLTAGVMLLVTVISAWQGGLRVKKRSSLKKTKYF
jgi:Protein of Unknown function (DUF2784)